MSIPFVSVVVPTYNRQQALATAIRSILAQTYQDFEIIVVDDGSCDDTAACVKALIVQDGSNAQGEPRIRYVFQPNRGQSAARNTGIAHARGRWIGFLDSDDTWLPDKLSWQVRAGAQVADACGACFTDARLVDSAGLDESAFARAGMAFRDELGVCRDALRRLAVRFGGIWLQTLLARQDLVRRIDGFDAQLRFAEDHDFLFRLALLTPFAYVGRPLAVIDRTSRNSDPTAQSRAWDRLDVRLGGDQRRLEKWLGLADTYPADVKRTVRRNLRRIHSGWANWHLEAGAFDAARQAAETAIGYQFTIPLAVKWTMIQIMPHLVKRIAPKATDML